MFHSQSAQQTLKLLCQNWKSFFASIKDYKKHPNKYKGKPKPPKYLKKDGRYQIKLTNQACKIREDGLIHFPRVFNGFTIKPSTKYENKKLMEIRILPRNKCFKIEVVWKVEIDVEKVKNEKYASIDLGINNLITLVNNIGENPIIINGKPIKSINQYYNKKKAKIQSELKICNNKFNSNKLNKLTEKRGNKINDYLHKASRFVIDYCIKNNIKTIIIGYNKNWKQDLNIGKVNNQKFTQTPFLSLIEKLEYKAEEYGITIIKHEESYTSKCSFLDLEPLKKKEKYYGTRVKRGLYKSLKGIKINADVNGAFNIMRKVVDVKSIEGLVFNPIMFTLC